MKNDSQSKSKILIVDDEQKNIQLLGSLLRQKDYIIGVATNGKQALDMLVESVNYDLVLLDINMPVMDGFETCKAIRKIEHLKDLPVIFLTAMAETESIVNGFVVGGQDYLAKPFNSNELLARVETHIDLKRSRDRLKQINEWLERTVKERTEELRIANRKLIQLDKAKSEFLSIISHEIRTPLNGILGPVSFLNEFDLDNDLKEMLFVLDSSARRLEEFSLKALDISQLSTKGRDALKLTTSDIREMLTALISEVQKFAKQKNISLKLNDELKDSITSLDRTLINKCFFYLIDNAIKFGKKDTEVIVKLTAGPDNYLISVENEGPQFPEDFDLANIQPFATKAHADQSLSLSLFLCKLIMEAHFGQIETINTSVGVRVTIGIPKLDACG